MRICNILFLLTFFLAWPLRAQSFIEQTVQSEEALIKADYLIISRQGTQSVTAVIKPLSKGSYKIYASTSWQIEKPAAAVLVLVSEHSTREIPVEFGDQTEFLTTNHIRQVISEINSEIINAQSQSDKLLKQYEILKNDARLIGDIAEIDNMNSELRSVQFELNAIINEQQVRENNLQKNFTLDNDPYVQSHLDIVQKDLLQLRQSATAPDKLELVSADPQISEMQAELTELRMQRQRLEARVSEQSD